VVSKRVQAQVQAGTPALVALAEAAVRHTVHDYAHDPTSELGYGAEAATALGVEAGRVFKTLVVAVDSDLAVAVVPVDRQLDFKAFARAVSGKRAVLAEAIDAERATGYVVGGISPIGQRRRLRTVVDQTSLDQQTVYVSAGRRGLDVELAPGDLVSMTSAVTALIARA